MLNNNGPKIEPCGTPVTTSYQSLYEESISILFSVSDVIGSY